MQLKQELEWNKNMNNWLKVLINANWKKKEIMLVERLIDTEKREKKTHLSEYMTSKW